MSHPVRGRFGPFGGQYVPETLMGTLEELEKVRNEGQALLALRMEKKRVIAEAGAGQHGVAVATVAARFGLECTVYMGTEDMRRQSMNVRRMKLLGAEVKEVTSGSKTLKDATSEAI